MRKEIHRCRECVLATHIEARKDIGTPVTRLARYNQEHSVVFVPPESLKIVVLRLVNQGGDLALLVTD